MNKNKFRFWNPQTKLFVTDYKYNGLVDELFEPDKFLIPQQFLGILDSNMKEVYEDDVVKFVYSSNECKLGVIEYMDSYCAYVINYDNGYVPIMNIAIDSLEIVGNIMRDYIWNENGELIKNEQRTRREANKNKHMSDMDFEFNMDFALMDQQIEKFKEENSRILNEWYQDCKQLHVQIADLHNINNKLKEMYAQTVNKLIETGITLADVGIQKLKLTIENEELKEKLNKHENN